MGEEKRKMSNRKLKIKRGYTNRGFGLLTFEDDYGEKCSLQMSSSVEPHVWLGIDKPKILKGLVGEAEELPDGVTAFSRMHLNRKQARQLAEELEIFAARGELE